MKKGLFRVFLSVTLLLTTAGLLATCSGGAGGTTAPTLFVSTTAGQTTANKAFQWPDTLHFAATGSSGEAKVVSWASVMQSDLKGPIIRVVNEPAWTNTYKDMANNQMVLSQIDKSTLSDDIQAINEYALPDGGPWPASLVWIDALASTGFMVRGDSDIRKPEDIKPGTKIAIWNDKSATLSPFRSLLAWGNINEIDIVWVNTGDYDAGARAVTQGRADICMAAPVSPTVIEASASPSGIRYISLNPKDNPEGAKRFLQKSTLYDFGPITVGPKAVQGTWAIASYRYLGANLNTDTELIYNIAKWLDLNYAKYKDRYESNDHMTYDDVLAAIQTSYIPLHPGLVKYLKEKGVWNQDYELRNQKNTALLQQYIKAYQDALKKAAEQNIEIKTTNPKWIEFWENYKFTNKIPVIQMHATLTQDALTVLPPGYVPPGTAPAPTAPASSTSSPASTTAAKMEVPIEIVSISEAHPGDDVTVNIKTAPGAEVKILFTMPNGTNSTFPADNTKIAGPDGSISWKWNINSRVPAGEAIYSFTAKLDGKQSELVFKKKI